MDDIQLYLTVLQEECAETIQIISKIFRFGAEDWHPNDILKTSNKERLIWELADILAVIDLLKDNGFLKEMEDEKTVEKLKANKIKKVEEYRSRGVGLRK